MKFSLPLLCSIAISFFCSNTLLSQHETEITSEGIVYPRLTTAEKNALTPTEGQVIYNTTTNIIEYYDGTSWVSPSGGSGSGTTVLSRIEDADSDTQVDVESTSDNDIIELTLDAKTNFKFIEDRLEFTNGVKSVHIGKNAGINTNQNADRENVFIGETAGENNSTGKKNVFIGLKAGNSNGSGINNTYIGERAGENTSSGNYNSFFGSEAGKNTSQGTSNLFLGRASGFTNNNGNFNVFVGNLCGQNNTSGEKNTFLGLSAGSGNTTGDLNVCIGYEAGSSGNHNQRLFIDNTNTSTPLIYGQFDNDKLTINGKLGIGTQSGINDEIKVVDVDFDGDVFTRLIAGAGQVIIGYNPSAQGIIGTTSNHNFGFRTNNMTRMTILNTGNVGIGTISPTQKLHVVGNICYTGTSSACSDKRYKKDIQKIPYALDKVLSLNGVYYYWKKDEYPNQAFTEDRQIGVIAQELEELFPEMVMTDQEGYKSVDYARLTPVLIESIKTLHAKLNAQSKEYQSELKDIKNEMALMESSINSLIADYENLFKDLETKYLENQTVKD